MENQIKKYTNEVMNTLISTSKYRSNSLNLKIPLTYILSLVPLTWDDVYFAFRNGYINIDDVIDFAIYEVEKDNENDIVLELAGQSSRYLTEENLISNYFNNLIKIDETNIMNSEKILYIVLQFLYENITQFEDPWQAIEVIYDDFNYNEDISNLVRYRIQETIFEKFENEEEFLFYNWELYLTQQKQKYKTGGRLA